MSLDVYLMLERPTSRAGVGSGIFVRENGATVEITREEWGRRHPDREPLVMHAGDDDRCAYYTGNVTHNLAQMAGAAELYEALWRPDENGMTLAQHLIKPLTLGLARLRANPSKYKAHTPPNGWGSYEGLVSFVESYLRACEQFPEATVEVSR